MEIKSLEVYVYVTSTLTYDSMIQTHKVLKNSQSATNIGMNYLTLTIHPNSFSETYLIREIACVELFSFVWAYYCMPLHKNPTIKIMNIHPCINKISKSDILVETKKLIQTAFWIPKYVHNQNTSNNKIIVAFYKKAPEFGFYICIQRRQYQETISIEKPQGHAADFLFSCNIPPTPNVSTAKKRKTISNASQEATTTKTSWILLDCGHTASIPTDKMPEYAYKIPIHEDNADIQIICKVLAQFVEEGLLATEVYCRQCEKTKVVSSFKRATYSPSKLFTSTQQSNSSEDIGSVQNHPSKGLEGYEFEHITIEFKSLISA